MKADNVSDVEERVQRAYTLYANRDLSSCGNIGIIAYNAEAKGLGAKGGRSPDPTEADNSKVCPRDRRMRGASALLKHLMGSSTR